MQYRRLGKTGLKVSLLSFGSWVTFAKQIEQDIAASCMHLAYDNGINFFDNAEIYARGQSEVVMGEVLKKAEWPRDSYVVSSKVFWGGDKPTQKGLSMKHVTEACHAALRRLQLDYLDLYFCHRPDYDTPVEETVWAMNTLIRQGKILYWGTSEWPAHRIMEAHVVAKENGLIPPAMEQPQYNLFERHKVELDYLSLYERGLGTTIWSPLASGLLTGKYLDNPDADGRLNLKGFEWLKEGVLKQERNEKVRQLKALADELGVSLALLSIAWTAINPNVSTVILGASKVAQLEENLKTLDVMPLLTAEVLEKIEAIMGNKPVRETF